MWVRHPTVSTAVHFEVGGVQSFFAFICLQLYALRAHLQRVFSFSSLHPLFILSSESSTESSIGNKGVVHRCPFFPFLCSISLPFDGKETKSVIRLGDFMARRPDEIFVVDEDECFGCGACIALCPLDVLTLVERVVLVDEASCSHCELCIPSCPVEALLFNPR